MRSRAAIFVEPGQPLIIDEVEFGEPGPGEVLVRNFASGICHSQLHQMFGANAQPGPFLLGHEATSEVVSVGPDVTHVQPGDLAFVTWIPRDAAPGDGYPAPTETPVTWQGQRVSRLCYTWSEHTLTRQELIVRAPDGIPTDVTSIIGCAVMTGAGAVVNSADVQAGESAAVFGVGGVGLSCIAGLAVRGASPLIAVDLDDAKLELARRFGATETINASELDPVAEIKRLTGAGVVDRRGQPLSGLDYAFDCIGKTTTIRQIIEAVRPGDLTVARGGTAMLVGIPDGEPTIDAGDLLRGEKHFTASWGGSCRPDRDFGEFVRWYQEGMLDLDAMITERVRLDDINEAVERLRRGEVLGRAIIEF